MRRDFFRKLNNETESARQKLREVTENCIPIPTNMNLHAEYKVTQRLLEMGLDAVHNKEGRWPQGKRRDSADICVFCKEKTLLVEIKYSKYWKTNSPKYRWQFQNINPEKFDLLILVAEAPDTGRGYRFFVFTKKEANQYTPPFDWAWRPENHEKYANRWIGIYERPDDWIKHVKEWKPKRENPQNAKNNYMVSENNYVGYIASHLNDFEGRWDKILDACVCH